MNVNNNNSAHAEERYLTQIEGDRKHLATVLGKKANQLCGDVYATVQKGVDVTLAESKRMFNLRTTRNDVVLKKLNTRLIKGQAYEMAFCMCSKTCRCLKGECSCPITCSCPDTCCCPEDVCVCPQVCSCPEICNCPAICACPNKCNCPPTCSCPPRDCPSTKTDGQTAKPGEYQVYAEISGVLDRGAIEVGVQEAKDAKAEVAEVDPCKTSYCFPLEQFSTNEANCPHDN